MSEINRFRECREKTPYSQKQVALIIGVKPPQISKWESGGGISRRNCIKIAKLYNVSADYLLGLSDNPEPKIEAQTKKEPAIDSGPLDDFKRRIELLTPQSKAILSAYLDGLLDNQSSSAP